MYALTKNNWNFDTPRLPNVDYDGIYKKVKDYLPLTNRFNNGPNNLEGLRQIMVYLHKIGDKKVTDYIFRTFWDAHHSKKNKSPPKQKAKSPPKAAPKAKSPPPIGPGCLQTKHSKYLHDVIAKKVVRNDRMVLDLKMGDTLRKKYIELSRIYLPDKLKTDPHAKYLFGLIGDSYNRLKQRAYY